MLEKLFKLKENKTDVRTEVVAGITTFMTMAYILAVNPSVLSAAGMNHGAVLRRRRLRHVSVLCSWLCLQTIRLHLHREWD